MKHNVHITSEKRGAWLLPLKRHIRSCIETALRVQNVTVPCEINVLICTDDTIHALNLTARKVDRVTDVLSFPMFPLTPGTPPTEGLDPETGLLPLGDMAICYDQAVRQAEEYGHSVRREVGYLTVHSILHLLGYDHVDEGEMKRQMRAAEEEILAEIDLPRE